MARHRRNTRISDSRSRSSEPRLKNGTPDLRSRTRPASTFGQIRYLDLVVVAFLAFAIWKWCERHQLRQHQDEHGYPTPGAVSGESTPVSAILRNNFAAVQANLDHAPILKTLLGEPPMIDKIKPGLRKVQERIAGLKAQCHEYEKLGHMPGGPSNFIASAKREAAVTLGLKLLTMKQELDEAVAKMKEPLSKTVQRGLDNVKRWTHECDALRVTKDPIWLDYLKTMPNPDTETDTDETRHNHEDPNRLQEILEQLKNLPALYEKFENDTVLSFATALSLGVPNVSTSTVEALPEHKRNVLGPVYNQTLESHRQLAVYLLLNRPLIQEFHILASKQAHHILNLTKKVLERQNNTHLPYMKLFEFTQREILNLLTRIDNLKYKYDKKKIPKIEPLKF